MYPQYTNPVNDFYFRNSQPQLPQMMSFPTPQSPQINCRFVTNIEEARAAMIDPVSYNLFLDTNSGKIYLKKLGNNGQSEFLSYLIEESKDNVNDPISEINSRLINIEKYLGEIRNESISGNASTQQSESVINTAVAESYESDDATESTSLPEVARNDFWKNRR